MVARGHRGAASVEYVALVALIGLLATAAVAGLIGAPRDRASRLLGQAIARRIVCAPKLRPVCHPNPLALAYGAPLAKLVRAMAPQPVAKPNAQGVPLVGVDFRYCRRPSCAVPSGSRPGGLTVSRRRATAFTAVTDSRLRDGHVQVDYWLYRPSIGWEQVRRTAARSDVAAASTRRLRISDEPVLVPLETLPGRNHYPFPAREEPPWRWRVSSRSP